MMISKNLQRFLASTLVLLQVGTLSGCHTEGNSFKDVKDVKGKDSMIDLIPVKVNNTYTGDTKYPVSTALVPEMITFMDTLDSITDSKEELDSDFLEKHDTELHEYTTEEYFDVQVAYALNIYKDLQNKGIDNSVIAQELHNLMIEQLTPSDNFTEEEWIQLFGTLLSNTNEEESFYEKHILLAWYTHRSVCEEEHTITEYGAITCPVIEKQNILVKTK